MLLCTVYSTQPIHLYSWNLVWRVDNEINLTFTFHLFQFFVISLEAVCMIQNSTANRTGLFLLCSRASRRQNNWDKTKNLTVVTLPCSPCEFSSVDVAFNIKDINYNYINTSSGLQGPNCVRNTKLFAKCFHRSLFHLIYSPIP